MPANSAAEPAAIAGYTLLRQLGAGGMGTVYLAQHPRLPRMVALKLLSRAMTDEEDVRARFWREAEHVARLDHPNIVTVHDRGDADGQLWISMQYVEGADAANTLARHGPFAPELAAHVVAETAKALDYAHAEGVLHRDVKPANILLQHSRPGRVERVLLGDFGIAKALAETTYRTATGVMVASLQYAAPEQFSGAPLDERADVYALGCTLFHLLTGQLPYPGTTLAQLWHGHTQSPVPRVTGLRPDLPVALDEVVRVALSKDRADRFTTCGDLARATTAALVSAAASASAHQPTHLGENSRSAASGGPPTLVRAGLPSPPPRPRGHPPAAVARSRSVRWPLVLLELWGLLAGATLLAKGLYDQTTHAGKALCNGQPMLPGQLCEVTSTTDGVTTSVTRTYEQMLAASSWPLVAAGAAVLVIFAVLAVAELSRRGR